MFDRTTIEIWVAIATLAAPAAFLATLAVAGNRRSRGLTVGRRAQVAGNRQLAAIEATPP